MLLATRRAVVHEGVASGVNAAGDVRFDYLVRLGLPPLNGCRALRFPRRIAVFGPSSGEARSDCCMDAPYVHARDFAAHVAVDLRDVVVEARRRLPAHRRLIGWVCAVPFPTMRLCCVIALASFTSPRPAPAALRVQLPFASSPDAIPCPLPSLVGGLRRIHLLLRRHLHVSAWQHLHHPAGIIHGPHPGAYENQYWRLCCFIRSCYGELAAPPRGSRICLLRQRRLLRFHSDGGDVQSAAREAVDFLNLSGACRRTSISSEARLDLTFCRGADEPLQ